MSRNLIIIMSDEHQARALSCAGHSHIKTPNIDALAARGVRFTNAYTPSPICVPARAAFATGRYVHQNRLWDNAMPYTGQIPGWGHCLQQGGVRVESIGKLHYRFEEDPAGFDVEHMPMMVADGVGMVWASIRHEDERISPESRMLGDYIGPGESLYTTYDRAVVERTRQWLADNREKGPWCLFVGLVAPHFPLVVPTEFFELYPLDSLPPDKLRPCHGHARHPWVEKQNAFMDSEANFANENERLTAVASYFGLCSWLDHNVGIILNALEEQGLSETTTIIYTSDHGDNVGARGLWGKSNCYEESAAIPLIMAGPYTQPAVCETPVSLLDVSPSIPHHFGLEMGVDLPGRPLQLIKDEVTNHERIIFSEYHAAGAVSGAFMLRRGCYKLIYYVGFDPELFDLADDPQESVNLANNPAYAKTLSDMTEELRRICDPEAVDALAHSDQAALIALHGGRERALKLGALAATPPPEIRA